MEITIIYTPCFLEHDTGGGDHPELPERITSILDVLENGAMGPTLHKVAPKPVSRAMLLAFHEESWLFRFEEAVLSGKTYIDHQDNQVGFESYNAALFSAGAPVCAIDLLESGDRTPKFCLVRPPGHHAEPNRPFGFCFFNNCAIAARHWQQQYGRRRICIIDFDAHHGNGIQTCCEMDPELLYISIHEHPSFSYPGTGYEEERGLGKGKGSIINLPLMPGAGDAQLEELLPQVEQAIAGFAPDALIVAAGFDGHQQDDMSGLNYSTGLFERLGQWLSHTAATHCHHRMISVLEGGYNLDVLAQSVEAYLKGLKQSDLS
jgi:acetoin utilization deacetylase AcuC-like enzyme